LKKFSLPKKEKEERVCELIKQGKGVREIAAAEHVSFTEIKKIRNKHFETDEDETGQNRKRSEALKLMEEGKLNIEDSIHKFFPDAPETWRPIKIKNLMSHTSGLQREGPAYDNFKKIWKLNRDPYLLETSCPGIFAAGDVRAGAMNRVASAVGEGSMAISFVHKYLAEV